MRDFHNNYVCSNPVGKQPDAMLYTATIERTDDWQDHYLVPLQDRRDFLKWTATLDGVRSVFLHYQPPGCIR